MKSLAKGRMRMVRKDAEKKVQREKFSQRATSKGAQRRIGKKKGSASFAEPCTRDENLAKMHKPGKFCRNL